MNDDWRLQVDFPEVSQAQILADRLDAPELEHDLSEAFQDRVVISRDGARMFLYAGTRQQAEKASDVVKAEARRHEWTVDIDFRRWHPIAEEWEDPDKPLPADNDTRYAERKVLMAHEREDAKEKGYPEFEVRVDLPSRHDAVHLSRQLDALGILAVHRWKYLLVGATDEDSAKALAQQIRDEAPPGSRVNVEGTWAAAYAERPSPFAVLAV